MKKRIRSKNSAGQRRKGAGSRAGRRKRPLRSRRSARHPGGRRAAGRVQGPAVLKAPSQSREYSQAYDEGFNAGFAKGYEDGLIF